LRTRLVRRSPSSRRTGESATAAEGSFARSATRLVALFEALATSEEGVSLADLSAGIGAPKSSLLGILRSMVANGYMEHGHGLYRLGPKSFRLAADILAIRRFPNLVRPILQELAAKCGETVFLVVLDHLAQRCSYADVIESANPVRYTVPTGTSRPLYSSAGGLMLLAYQEPGWIDAYIRVTHLEPLTPRTISDPATLRERLATIRREGFAISRGETIPGATGLAAPIFNADGSVTAGLLIGLPMERFEERLPELKRLLHEATTRVAGIPQAIVEEQSGTRD
jgi:IclR family transcriptional regulator, acetate operon repressor